VTAAADGDQQVVGARERNRLTYIVVVEATRDQRRALVVHAVPDLPRGIVLRVARKDDGAGQALAELSDGSSLELYLGSVERYGLQAGLGLGGFGRLSVTPR
jgi:hypothetical protein